MAFLTPIQQQLLGTGEFHLSSVSKRHQLSHETKRAFLALQKAAQEAGFDLQLVSSFRSFDRQLAIWNNKFSAKRPVLDMDNRRVDMNSLSEEEKLHAIMLFSALPGASRHHWGTDFDYFDANEIRLDQIDLTPDEYEDEDSPCYGLKCWLDENAESFGFFFPYSTYQGGIAAEPWHLSFKEEAERLAKEFTPELLNMWLAAQPIEGKSTILENLPTLFERYMVIK